MTELFAETKDKFLLGDGGTTMGGYSVGFRDLFRRKDKNIRPEGAEGAEGIETAKYIAITETSVDMAKLAQTIAEAKESREPVYVKTVVELKGVYGSKEDVRPYGYDYPEGEAPYDLAIWKKGIEDKDLIKGLKAKGRLSSLRGLSNIWFWVIIIALIFVIVSNIAFIVLYLLERAKVKTCIASGGSI